MSQHPNNGINAPGRERQVGLDLLRILSMLMIVILHSHSHGGMTWIPETGMDGYSMWFWAIQSFSSVAVDVFVLISAYFLCQQPFRLSRVLRTAYPIWFYSWGIGLLLILAGAELSFAELISTVFPISFRRYWFMTAYIGMYLISPILNKLINLLNRRQHLAVTLLMVFMSVIWSDIIPLSDPFSLSSGFTTVWFVVLYMVASYLRLHVDFSKIRFTGWVYLGCTALLQLIMLLLYWLSQKITVLQSYDMYQYYYRYNSIVVLISSVALFMSFQKLSVRSNAVRKLILRIAPLTLGVYLIHDNPSMRNILWKQWFPMNQWERNLLLPGKVMAAVLAIFVGCLLVEAIRRKLFGLLESRKWHKKLVDSIDRIVGWVYNKLPN